MSGLDGQRGREQGPRDGAGHTEGDRRTVYSVLGTPYLQLVFWPALTVWSWLLVKPAPFEELAQVLASWAEFLAFLASKTLHLTGYAGFLFLAFAAFPPRHRRWTVPFIVLHGPLSELAQYYGNLWFDTKRTGCVRDVIIDWTGMALGYGAWRLVRRTSWWANRSGEETETGGVVPVRPGIGCGESVKDA